MEVLTAWGTRPGITHGAHISMVNRGGLDRALFTDSPKPVEIRCWETAVER